MTRTESKFKSHAYPSFKFLDSLNVDQDVKRRLSINLSNIYSGSNDIYMTPIGKEHGPDRLLSEWDKVFQENKSVVNSVLYEIEMNQRSKYGPLSIAKPWSERKKDTLAYFSDKDNIDYSSIQASPDMSRNHGSLRPISLEKGINYLKNSTNSGLPYYTKKGKVKGRLLTEFDTLLNRQDPCILFTRTQELGKTRDVWGYPIADTLNEMMYYRPLLEHQRKLFWRSALNGPEEVSKRMTHIIHEARSSNLELISVDFSNYDRSIKRGLQTKATEYYSHLFQSSFTNELNRIAERKVSIGLVTPDGVLTGEHGEPSGSTFTNEDDSIVQYLVSRHSGSTIGDLFDIQGDDGVYAISSDRVSNFYANFKTFGLNINEDKSDRSKNYLVYLQNLHHIDYEKNGIISGIYPIYRALNRIVYQERWSDFEDFGLTGKDYYAIRTIAILENCKHHPLFKELVKFVLKYDKYGLRPSQKGVRDYVKMISDSSGVEGILQNQLGDNLKGILKFSSVELISSLG